MMKWLIIRLAAVITALMIPLIPLGSVFGNQLSSQTLTLSYVKANWETELVLLDVECRLSVRWFIPGQSFTAQWSTDGERLALSQFVPPPPYPGDRVFVWERGVLSQPEQLQIMDFSWSPDSTQFALSLNMSANFDIGSCSE